MIKLLIAGYHGYGNCGDEAILRAMTSNIRNMAKDVEITALSYAPEFTKKEYKINSVGRFNVFAVINAIRKSDIVLSGGGTLLQNGTSTRSLLYYLAIIRTAKFFGKKVMLYANGIGPINGEKNRALVKKIIDRVDLITLREKLSEADLKSIGVAKPDITVTADPAFTLTPADKEQTDRIFKDAGIDNKGFTVGVSVRRWSKAFGGDDYIKKIAAACDRLAKNGKTIVFLPMEYPTDIEVSRLVAEKMSENAYILDKRYTPTQILGIIGRFDIMLSMRLHSLIFAAVQNVPMMGIIYDPKIEYYLKELDMPEVGDVRKELLDPDKIVKYSEEITENLTLYKEKLLKSSEIMKKKAKENDILLSKKLLDPIRKGKNK